MLSYIAVQQRPDIFINIILTALFLKSNALDYYKGIESQEFSFLKEELF